ncbi:FAD/NAD(P)-binding protein [Kutzneria sp. 744]|uniref:FAD/NAD(P)-binding protein n=1 Tax=Kutzneria sp. (strain 744) TaxID=345341 RepID=UPI0003EECE7C|nr:FAD/NAD(P)-binding protein [Kutzneria sp. 744]EWM10208.1 heterodisulfide reductase, cytochrome reductase subunit [Kutzneria sp. 744]
MTEEMLPARYVVTGRTAETADSATLRLAPVDRPIPRFQPGQFTMLYARGVGEIAVSISGDPSVVDTSLTQTIRAVGAVSRALHAAQPGTVVGVRGPYGVGWQPSLAWERDALIVAGGVGLAPLRPVVLAVLAQRWRYRRAILVAGARTPREFLYSDELKWWSSREDMAVELTVDHAADDWTGQVGFVTQPLSRLPLDPAATTAFICGPEPMMRYSAETLLRRGVHADRIRISLERNMQCGIGQCGHCQLGPLLVCRDGPVVDYAVAADLLSVREL